MLSEHYSVIILRGFKGVKFEGIKLYFFWVNIFRLLMFLLLFLQSYMDSEIRAIMAQYMPLDSQAEVPNHVNDERA